jgi:hypothetical protein
MSLREAPHFLSLASNRYEHGVTGFIESHSLNRNENMKKTERKTSPTTAKFL